MEHVVEVDLLSKLNALAEQFRTSFSSINYGGCGVVAAMIGTYLGKRHIPVAIRVADYDSRTIDTIRKTALSRRMKKSHALPSKREWNGAGISFQHVIVEFEYEGKKYHFDSNGCVPASEVDPTFGVRLIKGSLSLPESRKIAKADSWNNEFDRSQIPLMKRMAARFFRKQFAI